MRFETSGQDSKNRIFTPFGDIYIDVENLFEQILGDRPVSRSAESKHESAGDSVFRPCAGVSESDDSFTVALDLPGVDADDVSIELLDGELKVAGVRKFNDVGGADRIVEETRLQGNFERIFLLDSQLDEDEIEASFENGVLRIVVPKAAKSVARKIKIKVGNTNN